MTNSSGHIVTFRTPENIDFPLSSGANEVELVCRDAISNECNIKGSIRASPFDYERIFDMMIELTSGESWQDEISSTKQSHTVIFPVFKRFLKTYEHLGYSFTDEQMIWFFRRLDKSFRGSISREDFEEEFLPR